VSFDEALAQAAKEIPAGRLGSPEDFGPMGAFLASDKAAYITGSMIRVDGGRVRGML
jgi:3-oxoacyl-[acyl-carrier protein] reductase